MQMQKNCNTFVMKARAGLPAASTTVQCVVAKILPGAVESGIVLVEVNDVNGEPLAVYGEFLVLRIR